MKTKKEILELLSKNGYRNDEVRKIAGYLLGSKITEKGEKVNYHDGNGTFDEFFDWLNEEPKKNVFSDIAANLDYLLNNAPSSIPDNIKKKTEVNISFLMGNCEYLQDCVDRKEEAEFFLNDVAEVLSGLNETLSKILENR